MEGAGSFSSMSTTCSTPRVSGNSFHCTGSIAIVVHPGIQNERMFVHNTELYLIEARGPGVCLHKTPRQIFELE